MTLHCHLRRYQLNNAAAPATAALHRCATDMRTHQIDHPCDTDLIHDAISCMASYTHVARRFTTAYAHLTDRRVVSVSLDYFVDTLRQRAIVSHATQAVVFASHARCEQNYSIDVTFRCFALLLHGHGALYVYPAYVGATGLSL